VPNSDGDQTQPEIPSPSNRESEESMTTRSFSATFTVDETPKEVFAAINNVRGWWTGEIQGNTDCLGEEFTYRYKAAHYSKQRITELALTRESCGVWWTPGSAVQ
jgi:hypothetical protein